MHAYLHNMYIQSHAKDHRVTLTFA